MKKFGAYFELEGFLVDKFNFAWKAVELHGWRVSYQYVSKQGEMLIGTDGRRIHIVKNFNVPDMPDGLYKALNKKGAIVQVFDEFNTYPDVSKYIERSPEKTWKELDEFDCGKNRLDHMAIWMVKNSIPLNPNFLKDIASTTWKVYSGDNPKVDPIYFEAKDLTALIMRLRVE